MVPGIRYIGTKRLIEGMKGAINVFHFRKELTQRLSGVHERVSGILGYPSIIIRVEQKPVLSQKNHIQCLTFYDEMCPSHLREYGGTPIVLFYKGNVDLNTLHIINMVDTRHATGCSTQLCAIFLRGLRTLCPDVLVVSGLAHDIDINAHRSAPDNDLPTVGALAHRLDRVYPSLHRKTAVEILDEGELLTGFPIGTTSGKHNFISRDRIAAGVCDATVVVESTVKGGPLITAELAESYRRDCFALPGRITDGHSKGYNQLIRGSRMSLLLSTKDLVEMAGRALDSHPAKVGNVQRSLFLRLTEGK